MEGRIKVTSDVLKERAEDAKNKISTMLITAERINEIIGRTKGYWVGEAGELCRVLYSTENEEILKILKRLQSHPDNLMKMAQVYEITEKQAEHIVNSLPIDVIE